MEPTLTLEHIPPGQFPEWLFSQLCEQVVDPRLEPILVIHSSDAARAEILHRLESANIGPIDRSRHHALRRSKHPRRFIGSENSSLLVTAQSRGQWLEFGQ